jgi:hypothetical protein
MPRSAALLETTMGEHSKIRFHGNILSAFEQGAELDLRFRVALQLISGPLFQELVALRPAVEVACSVLDLAEELFKQGEGRGWIEDLPDDDGLSAGLRMHLRRAVRAQIYQQGAGGQIGADMAPRVATPPGVASPGANVLEMPPSRRRAIDEAAQQALSGEANQGQAPSEHPGEPPAA